MIGLNVKEPENTCDDPNCPFHGNLSVRGQVLEGIVTTNKAERTITAVSTNSLENMKDTKKEDQELTFTNLIVLMLKLEIL